MARSVSVPFNAQRVLYINLYDFENYFDQEYALDDFIQAICKRAAPAVGVRDGYRVTATLAAIHQSLASGGLNTPIATLPTS